MYANLKETQIERKRRKNTSKNRIIEIANRSVLGTLCFFIRTKVSTSAVSLSKPQHQLLKPDRTPKSWKKI